MPSTKNIRSKLEFLVRATGRPEADIVAQAIDQGLDDLYRHEIADGYLNGTIDRQKALAELGRGAVEELDYARQAIQQDVEWGLKSA